MFRSTLLAATAAFAAVASAQNYSTSGNLTINVQQIDSPTRQSWCRAQTNSCPMICGGRAQPNNCDPDTLTFNCVCTNGNQPNISDYDQTIPSFICAQWIANCVDNHPNDLDGLTGCRSVTCGDKNASSNLPSTTSSSMSEATESSSSSSDSDSSSTMSGSGSGTTDSTSSPSPSSSDSAAIALNVAEQYGTGIIAGGLLALFGLVL